MITQNIKVKVLKNSLSQFYRAVYNACYDYFFISTFGLLFSINLCFRSLKFSIYRRSVWTFFYKDQNFEMLEIKEDYLKSGKNTLLNRTFTDKKETFVIIYGDVSLVFAPKEKKTWHVEIIFINHKIYESLMKI